MKREFLTVPNLLSLSRVVLLIPFVAVMLLRRSRTVSCGRSASSFLAGADRQVRRHPRAAHAAQNRNGDASSTRSPTRSARGSSRSSWCCAGYIPVWFLALLVARDLLIVAGGIYVKRKTGEVLPSNTAGKWAMGVVFVDVVRSRCMKAAGAVPGGAVSPPRVIMLGVSFVQYLRRFVQVIRLAAGGAVMGLLDRLGFGKLKEGLARTREGLARKDHAARRRRARHRRRTLDELEEILIAADVGVGAHRGDHRGDPQARAAEPVRRLRAS